MNQRAKDSKLLEAQKERKIMKSSKIIFNVEKSTKPKFDARLFIKNEIESERIVRPLNIRETNI